MDVRHGLKPLLCLSVFLLSGCGAQTFTVKSPDNEVAATFGPEPANCTPMMPIPDPVTVTGKGTYQYRATNLSGPSSTWGLNGNPVTADVRYAEVAIFNSDGTFVQCGETQNDGTFSIQIPKAVGNYNVQIYSRSTGASSKVNASVLEDIYSSSPYAIVKDFAVDSTSTTVSVGTLEAKARATDSAKIEGGAFFIYDNLLWANERIRSLIGDSTFIAPKSQTYWRAGFNPYSYFGSSSLASFYVNGERKMYILGGKNGDVKFQDTDHFDPSVIIHEYGHFLEDAYGHSESPGGSHNGNSLVDPRLGWSEGWANYLQSELLNGRYFSKGLYIDTIGFKNDAVEGGHTGSGVGIKFDLSTDGATSSMDPVVFNGEGTFRELSISRMLYKTTRSPASNSAGSKGAAIPFVAIWDTFKSSVSGFGGGGSVIFRSIAAFNEYLYGYISTNYAASLSDWTNNVVADEKQNVNRKDYADTVTRAATCASFPRAVQPVRDEDYLGAYYKSHLLRSNDFYMFYYDGSSQVINMTYTQSGAETIDLDLILWKSDYIYVEDEQEFFQGKANSYYAVRSRRLNPSVENGSESLSLAGLPAGYYLLNVKAVTFNRNTGFALTTSQLNGTANYTLNIVTNGTTTEFLCPAH